MDDTTGQQIIEAIHATSGPTPLMLVAIAMGSVVTLLGGLFGGVKWLIGKLLAHFEAGQTQLVERVERRLDRLDSADNECAYRRNGGNNAPHDTEPGTAAHL